MDEITSCEDGVGDGVECVVLVTEESTHMAFLFFNRHRMPRSDRV
jgi:hypothetical protein